jgi:hypothetical protein
MGVCSHQGCKKKRTHGCLCALHAMEHWQALENFRIEEGDPVVFRDMKIQQEDDWRASVITSSWVRSGTRFDPDGRRAFRGMRDGRSSKLPPAILDEELPTIPATGDDYGMTLAGMAEELGVCRERARGLIERALRKLRHPSRAKFLKEFLDD